MCFNGSTGLQAWKITYAERYNKDSGPLTVAVDSADNIYISNNCGTEFGVSSDVCIEQFTPLGVRVYAGKYTKDGIRSGINRDETVGGLAVDSARGLVYIVGEKATSASATAGFLVQYRSLRDNPNYVQRYAGNQQSPHQGYSCVAVDSEGYVWVAGWRKTGTKAMDILVQKLDPTTRVVLMSTTIATTVTTNTHSSARGIVTDANDNVYVVGTIPGSIAGLSYNGGVSDVVVAKYNKIGERLWIQLYGGDANDAPTEVVVDESKGLLYVVGIKTSTTFAGNSVRGDASFLLVLGLDDGLSRSVGVYPGAVDAAVAVGRNNIYMTGGAIGSFQGQAIARYMVNAYLMTLQRPSAPTSTPTTAPTHAPNAQSSLAPLVDPSAQPTVTPTAATPINRKLSQVDAAHALPAPLHEGVQSQWAAMALLCITLVLLGALLIRSLVSGEPEKDIPSPV